MKISKLFLAFSFIIISFAAQAQVGIGTNSPAASAQLEVSSSSKGLLIPQIALTGSTDAVTISNPASSLLVYNTATTSDVVKGYYYNSGTSGSPIWLRLNTGASGVPYTGATSAVNLGAYDLTVNGLIIGRGANQSLTTNTAIGNEALANPLTSDYATAVGYKALNQNSGSFSYGNSAFGAQALLNNQNGPRNTAIGFSSLERNIGGGSNTAVGVNSLYAVVNGGNNTAIGDNTLYINTGSNNTAIGASADVSSASLTNATAIGFDAKVGASNSIQLGNANVTAVKTSGTLTAGSVTYPNTHGSAGQVLSTTGSGTLTWTTASSDIHSIGEAYGGGIVFYVYDGGKHGLIASTEDQGIVRWGANNNSTRARADGVGAGVINTAIIIANQGPIDDNSFAATLCTEYSVTSDGVKYGGWYLPSKEELQLLFNQKSILTGLNGSWYYSSTETTDLSTPTTTRAWLINGNGSSSSWWRQDKSEAWSVRAIRSF